MFLSRFVSMLIYLLSETTKDPLHIFCLLYKKEEKWKSVQIWSDETILKANLLSSVVWQLYLAFIINRSH